MQGPPEVSASNLMSAATSAFMSTSPPRGGGHAGGGTHSLLLGSQQRYRDLLYGSSNDASSGATTTMRQHFTAEEWTEKENIELRLLASERQLSTIRMLIDDECNKLEDLNDTAKEVVMSWRLIARLASAVNLTMPTMYHGGSVGGSSRSGSHNSATGLCRSISGGSHHTSASLSPMRRGGGSGGVISVGAYTKMLLPLEQSMSTATLNQHSSSGIIDGDHHLDMSDPLYHQSVTPRSERAGAAGNAAAVVHSMQTYGNGASGASQANSAKHSNLPNKKHVLALKPHDPSDHAHLPFAKYVLRYPKTLFEGGDHTTMGVDGRSISATAEDAEINEVHQFAEMYREHQEQLQLLLVLEGQEEASVEQYKAALQQFAELHKDDLLKQMAAVGAPRVVEAKAKKDSPRTSAPREDDTEQLVSAPQPAQQQQTVQNGPHREEDHQTENASSDATTNTGTATANQVEEEEPNNDNPPAPTNTSANENENGNTTEATTTAPTAVPPAVEDKGTSSAAVSPFWADLIPTKEENMSPPQEKDLRNYVEQLQKSADDALQQCEQTNDDSKKREASLQQQLDDLEAAMKNAEKKLEEEREAHQAKQDETRQRVADEIRIELERKYRDALLLQKDEARDESSRRALAEEESATILEAKSSTEAELSCLKMEQLMMSECDKRRIVQLEGHLAAREELTTTLESICNTQKDMLDTMDAKVYELTVIVQNREHDCAELQQQEEATTQQCKALNEENEALAQELETLRQVHQQSMEQNTAQVAALAQTIAEKNADIEQLTSRIEDLKIEADVNNSAGVVPFHNTDDEQRREEVVQRQEWLLSQREAKDIHWWDHPKPAYVDPMGSSSTTSSASPARSYAALSAVANSSKNGGVPKLRSINQQQRYADAVPAPRVRSPGRQSFRERYDAMANSKDSSHHQPTVAAAADDDEDLDDGHSPQHFGAPKPTPR